MWGVGVFFAVNCTDIRFVYSSHLHLCYTYNTDLVQFDSNIYIFDSF